MSCGILDRLHEVLTETLQSSGDNAGSMIANGSNAVGLDQNGLDGIVLGGLGDCRGDGKESVHCASLEWRESQAGGACMERLFEG